MKVEILSVVGFDDSTVLSPLGGCSDNGEQYGLNEYYVDITVGANEKKYTVSLQAAERTDGMRNYAGWEMEVYTGAGDADKLSVHLERNDEDVFNELVAKAEELAKTKLENLIEESLGLVAVKGINGLIEWFDKDTVVSLMDRELCDKLHDENWSSEQQFVNAYARAHADKFGEEFVIN